MENMVDIESYYKGKKVLITGHTGFKGSWMSYILFLLGAEVTGIGLASTSDVNLFDILRLGEKIDSHLIDIRDLETVKKVFHDTKPEIVIHMAAQPLVIDSYKNPVYTFDVNVMGTVYICECIRLCDTVKSFINVTTDKVYQNNEWFYGYRETDRLNGYDPYSNSKSCSELITDSYRKSFFNGLDLAISTCRAGNVIGGGDFSENRIIPDCVKFTVNKQHIIVRNPNSTRPYQHVLEAVMFYLKLAANQEINHALSGCYNIGPEESDCVTNGEIVTLFCKKWGEQSSWNSIENKGLHEANFLKLDTSKAKMLLNWHPIWDVNMAIEKTVEWSKSYYNNIDIEQITIKQIYEYLGRI